MGVKTIFIGLALGLTASITTHGQQNELGWTMESAVRQLDRQGEDFESVLADIEVDWSNNEHGEMDIESGRLYMNDRGELRIIAEAPDKKTILLDGNTLYHYDPATSTVEEYSLSKHKDRLEVFIPIGFSVTGRDLSDDFLVTFIGENTTGSRRTLGLELTPKRDSVRAVVARMELWVDQASWLPARQVISQAAGGQTLTINYAGTARNLSLNSELFNDKWPKGTEKVRK